MAKSGRHLARRCAVQAIYQWQLTAQPPSDIEANFIKNEKLSERHSEYFLKLIKYVPANIKLIDELLAPFLDRDMEKVDLIEHAIMRIGVYELKYEQDIPTGVIIDEAIDLAKIFASEHGYKYVNGILDKVAKKVRKN